MTIRHFTIALLLALPCLSSGAQEIRITGFSTSKATASGNEPARLDADGRPCALLRMETSRDGWTFDAGLSGIMDVARGDGEILVWVPADARRITVSHPRLGVLRDWAFPVTLEPGCTYDMTLGQVRPKSVPVPVSPAPSPAPAPLRTYCSHFIDAYAGQCIEDGEADELFVGLRYTYLGGRVGPYAAIAFGLDESCTVFGGAAFRPGRGRGAVDLQLYGGAGLVYGCAAGGEVGIRIGWESDRSVSRWDFGAGCQFWSGCVTPTFEVGLCIWGIPVTVAVGLCLCALGI